MGGLYSIFDCFHKRELRVLILGLDAAGKTSILYRLKLNGVVPTIPTIGFNVETITYRNVNFTSWDVGGRDKMRPLYRHYYPNTHLILYIVDSHDRERLKEAVDELHYFSSEDELRDCLFIVVANKQDLDDVVSVEEITSKVEESGLLKGKRWTVLPASAKTGDGLYDILDYALTELTSKTPAKSGLKLNSKLDYFSGVWTKVKNAFL